MVHLKTLDRMREYLSQNLEQYVREHPGEFILIEGCPFNPLTITFYKTQEELNAATRKYEGLYGPTFLVKQIPTKIETQEEKFLERLIELTSLGL
ncbi:MAG: hypothetical protein AABX29_05085 [Nanoarchaeota archaeon]